VILFLENQDSFSWNVIDRLPFDRDRLRVIPGTRLPDDALASARAIVIGPGPTDPERAGLVAFVRETATLGIPMLGICLGHQAIGAAFGARVVRVEPRHGKRSLVMFEPCRFFPAFNGPVEVMRYHSLALTDVRAPLRVVAATAEGLPMAVEHEHLPIAGLQFHPASYATPRGEDLLRSFFQHAGLLS